ncbi:MAG: hypothetical protein HYT88_04770 [Candidatus Omnitrophica bacterium]|nr:hypothetical protein [Candidatus Omnitrophota bacterium]MBI2173826.1 hypothetical protein [Candidatus Omnitrophota bacterium]MBI3010233.1 hypothetical protein [Candidatus Omnitrophota bacterium]
MKLLILTSNAIRHKFVANALTECAEQVLVISECRPSDAQTQGSTEYPIREHFRLRFEAEQAWFSGNEKFTASTYPILYGEVNLPSTCCTIENFKADACVVFGASLIKPLLLSKLPAGKTINLHLGLSPYYRGSGTNFWPFVNNELEYVGSTLLHLDAGIDTGDIIAHVRPEFIPEDTVHTIGCQVIEKSADVLGQALSLLRDGKDLNRVSQWKPPDGRYYRVRDFTPESLERYYKSLRGGMIARYLEAASKRRIHLISLDGLVPSQSEK